ncbi:MAG: NUDIX domain-containing protein [Candidatus Bathyarchaeota archaeon]|nr:NUDIX domain-containing protein [Candidatus Bathyarchaeota archaeon]
MEKILVVGANVIEKDKKTLLMQETFKEVRGKWNFPAGRLEIDEDIIACTEREGEEETGFKVKPLYLIGIYQYYLTLEYNVTLFVFKSEIVRGQLTITKEAMDVRWFSFNEIKELDKKGLLVGSYILKALEDCKASKKIPLNYITVLKD